MINLSFFVMEWDSLGNNLIQFQFLTGIVIIFAHQGIRVYESKEESENKKIHRNKIF